MEKEIIVAIISAIAVVLAAIITGIFSKFSKKRKGTNISQKQKGQNNMQIGIQNNIKNLIQKDDNGERGN